MEPVTRAVCEAWFECDFLRKKKTEFAELGIERNRLLLRLQRDLRERHEILEEAIATFERVFQALYEESGSLQINPSPNGPEFQVDIHGNRSKGISNMAVFCFAMMMLRLCAARGVGPGFLIHDSHLFDGVDERQVAQALKIGAEGPSSWAFSTS